tara:strand:+ start:2501 stop:2887 length:387 start_codon:yes stop_codon:yes gene_type:complete
MSYDNNKNKDNSNGEEQLSEDIAGADDAILKRLRIEKKQRKLAKTVAFGGEHFPDMTLEETKSLIELLQRRIQDECLERRETLPFHLLDRHDITASQIQFKESLEGDFLLVPVGLAGELMEDSLGGVE